jgi:hypothetical protein
MDLEKWCNIGSVSHGHTPFEDIIFEITAKKEKMV